MPDMPKTPRLREVLVLLLQGLTNKQVARWLGISQQTVNGYVKELHRRYQVSSRAELLSLWVQWREIRKTPMAR